MSETRIDWHPDVPVKELEEHWEQKLDRIAIYVAGDIVAHFKIGNRKGRNPAKPGEIPHVGTVRMKRSVTHDRPGRLLRRVGSSLRPSKGQTHSYPFFQELGTRNMSPRPWLRPGLTRNRRIIKRGMGAR